MLGITQAHILVEKDGKSTTKISEENWFPYDKTKLKNRWDSLKRQFTSFAKLDEKETGLGWDQEKKIVQAPEEWWADKAKVCLCLLII